MKYSSLLDIQILKHVPEHLKEELAPFFDAIDSTYKHIEDDRLLIERALEISSDELNTKNRRLRSELKKQKQVIAELNELLKNLAGDDSIEHSNILELSTNLKEQFNRGQEALQELKTAKELAESNVKIKEMFLANVSHELRTPIHGIIGMTDIILNRSGNKPDKFYLETIKKSADGLFVLINDLLDFSKIESGELDFENIPFDLEDILKTIHTALSFKADSKNIAFNYHIGSNVNTHLIGDPYRLNQIFLNLTNNAIKFTQKGSVNINIDSVHLDGVQSLLTIEIKDTGIGIPKDKIPLLFDAFKQVDSSTTRKYGGTGLGLAICNKLVNLLGGNISLESKVNYGTTFHVAIPYRISTEPIQDSKKDSVNPEDLLSKKILIAEDHPVNQILISSILDNWNLKYDLVENGLQAVEQVEKNHYDIILMDIQMPEMDGIEATQRIKSSEKNQSLPIIALTANAIKGDSTNYKSKGMIDYLSKPFKPEDLFRVIKKNIK